jgi:hypothetical protein
MNRVPATGRLDALWVEVSRAIREGHDSGRIIAAREAVEDEIRNGGFFGCTCGWTGDSRREFEAHGHAPEPHQ